MGEFNLINSKHGMNMLDYMISIYNKMPPYLQHFLSPLGLRLYDFLVNTFDYETRENRVLFIPYQSHEMSVEYMRYKHKHKTPPLKKRFKNRFYSNDYSEVEEQASSWSGQPSLKASVIVASYNQKDTITLNLLAWAQQTYPLNLIEVIVADDGSSDGTIELVRDLQTQLPYTLKLYAQEDKGFRLAKLRNEGVALSNGDVVLFVDADTIPSREYIWEHMKYYHVAVNVAVVGMRHRIEMNIDENMKLSKDKLDDLKKLPVIEEPNASKEVKKWRKEVLFNNLAFRKQWNVWGGFHGTLTSCRRQDYIGVGGYDESFTVYGQEDSEMGYRLLAKVQYLVSNPKARLYHIEHQSNPLTLNPHNIEILKEKTQGPKITVYIAAYNAEHNIEKAVESVLNQTVEDCELIIVNDESTDGTGSILEKYRYHPRIRIYSKTHKGKGAASNIALLYSRGRYICPLNQDDLLMPNALEVLSDELDKDDRVGLVYAGYYRVENGEELPIFPEMYKQGSFLLDVVTSPMMWKKDYFLLTEGFNEDALHNPEYDIALKLEEITVPKEVNLILYKQKPHHHHHKELNDFNVAINTALKRRGIKLTAVSYDRDKGWNFAKLW
jgi:chondroitin synthase